MPQILEMKEVNEELWVKIPKAYSQQNFYVWSEREVKERDRIAVQTFCFDLADRWIESNAKPNQPPI